MKFERGKNPIDALNIGMEEELMKYLQLIGQTSNSRNHQLTMAVLGSRKDLAEYLLSRGATLTEEHLQVAVNRRNYELAKLIVERRPDLKKTLYISKYRMKAIPEPIVKLIK